MNLYQQEEEEIYRDARRERPLTPGDVLGGLVPIVPFIPHEEPAFIGQFWNAEQLKEYRMQSAPWIVRYHYDLVSTMIEDGIRWYLEKQYLDWLAWVERNL